MGLNGLREREHNLYLVNILHTTAQQLPQKKRKKHLHLPKIHALTFELSINFKNFKPKG